VPSVIRGRPGRAQWLPAAGLALLGLSCGVRPAPPAAPPHPLASAHPASRPHPATQTFGVVRASPGCPVERPGHPCPPRPVAGALIEARPLAGGVAVRTRTRAGGRYVLWLRPGRYLLAADAGDVVPRCPPVTVSVGRGTPVRADIGCDSGIR
jgi:hypothetical protein